MIGSMAAQLPPILTPGDDGVEPADQMRRFLLGEVNEAWSQWKADYETRTDPDAIRAHYAGVRAKMIAAIGGLPERTPLNPRITGVLHRTGFKVEKIIFESRPQFYVTANLYLPDPGKYAVPVPGVLVPCGHYMPAKAHDEYQSMGALLALNGMAALVYDPIEQGERLQSVDAEGKSRYWGTSAHTLDDIQAIPLGQSIARQFIWDGMRALDYLQSRPEIDPDRIGVTGNSGGGTQTSQLFALDDRIKAAAPSCYISHLDSQLHNSVGDGEQHLFGQLAIGADHPDLLLMHAPTPVKLLAATHDFFKIEDTWETFRYVKRTYTRLGRSEAADILENDAGHNYNRTQREAAARWMARWLRDENRAITEPDLTHFTEAELRCTPHGQVMLMPGARSIRDLFREDADRIAKQRKHTWSAMDAAERRAAVRRIADFRQLSVIPEAKWSSVWKTPGAGYQMEAFRVTVADGAVSIPALWVEPDTPSAKSAIVFASDEGFSIESGSNGRLARLAEEGRRVLAIDVRGLGETKQNNQEGMTAAVGRDYWDFYTAYSLGKTIVGMRAEDLLIAVREASRRAGGTPVELVAIGSVGVPALHAAFCEPQAIGHVSVEGTLASWDSVVRAESTFGQLMNTVHGALTTYDLPDLVAALGSTATIQSPAGPSGITPDQIKLSPADHLPSRSGLTGVRFGSPGFVNVRAVSELRNGSETWDTSHGQDWSAQWTGFIVPSVTTTTSFAVETNEEAVVRIGTSVTIEALPGSRGMVDGIAITAGNAIGLEVDMNKPRRESELDDHVSVLRILWKNDRGEWKPVPEDWMRHSRAQRLKAEMNLR